MPPLVVVLRFRVGADQRAAFDADAEVALRVLSAQPGFVSGTVGQATDDPELVLIATEWSSVGAYRRALSSYDVKVEAVGLLARAIDEPTAFELVGQVRDGVLVRSSGGLAADAGTVPRVTR